MAELVTPARGSVRTRATGLARRTARQAAFWTGLDTVQAAAAFPVPELAVPPYRLNVVCHPDAWDDPEWMMVFRSLGQELMHRKAWEYTQCVFGLERLGALGPSTRVLGVGAGYEVPLFYFANRCALVVATDIYDGPPGSEGDPAFMDDPGRWAPFPYREDRLLVQRADGCDLPFAAGSFDVVYSLSSIEHFGGHGRAAQAMREMYRVLRPGGIACVATELILRGGPHDEYFLRDELDEYILHSSGLVPVEKLHETIPPREMLDDPVWIDGDISRLPHIVLGLGELRWTSVIIFYRKPSIQELALRGLPMMVRNAPRRLVGPRHTG
jgi:SAM-dependent methyltransferase